MNKQLGLAFASFGLVVASAAGQVAPAPPAGPAVQEAYIKASNPDASDVFGRSVALSGDTLVVGAAFEDSAATGVNGNQASNSAQQSGAVYVFVRSGSGWSQQTYLKPLDTSSGAHFGQSVAISGDTLAVGAFTADVGSVAGAGAAYVFVRNGTSWSEQAKVTAPFPDTDDAFGFTVGVSGDTLVVTAVDEDSNATGVNGDASNDAASDAGAAYVFVRNGTSWSQQAYLKASNAEMFDEFGGAVAIDQDTIVVGAAREEGGAPGVNGDQSSNTMQSAGAAYVFVRNGTAWSQEAYVKASNPGSGDQFGASLAFEGDTLAVGALNESSSATGVNGDQSSNAAAGSGAAYVFIRNGSAWSQQAYLKPSNTGASDAFGASIALSGDLLVTGAFGEDSHAAGANGNGADNTWIDSGAAYLFTRNGASWGQLAYVKASFPGVADEFGDKVAASGSSFVVMAAQEDGGSSGVNGNQTNKSKPTAGAAYAFTLEPGPWTDLTLGLQGTNGVPALVGSGPLTGGSSNALQLESTLPSAPVTLVVGTQMYSRLFKGGAFVPVPLVLLPMTSDALGSISLPFTWPASVPAGTAIYLQYWMPDAGGVLDYAASNAVEGVGH